ncbi:MAG: B12-binding domain-containing radical SAM protein [Nitrospirae bacterium]|nr:B12-binding domain-containing radical SAM protein [Magnetococcales bacterium]HAT50168.1 hypothetical protein [Alphaproteobacteria bacterium]
MKVALLSYGAEGLGLQYLSAVLKRNGHECQLFFDPTLFDDKLLLHYPRLHRFFSAERWIIDEIAAYAPNIFGIQILTDTFPWANRFARAIRHRLPAVTIVAGGTHVTILPERVAEEPWYDYLVRGDGEFPMAKIAAAVSEGQRATDIPGVWTRMGDSWSKNELSPLEQDIAQFGVPDRSIYAPYVNTSKTHLAISSRGCLYACSFCHHNAQRKIYRGKGRYLRRLTPRQFVTQLREAFDLYQYQSLQIYDEIFTYDVEWLRAFVALYSKEVGVPYLCLGHPSCMSEEIVRLLKESGCFGIQIGIQSLNGETRRQFLQRKEDNVTIHQMIAWFEQYDLPYQPDMIFGLPGDTEADYVDAAIFFSHCHAAAKVNTLILSLQPQTDIVDHAINSGFIQEADKENIDSGKEGCRVGDSGSIRDQKLFKRCQNYMLLFKIAVYTPSWVTMVLLRTRLFLILRFFEPFLGHAIRLWNIDQRDVQYVRHYGRYLTEFFYRKVTGRRLFGPVRLRPKTPVVPSGSLDGGPG